MKIHTNIFVLNHHRS